MNRYSWVTNNPLRFRDPTGHIEDTGDDSGCGLPECELLLPPPVAPPPLVMLSLYYLDFGQFLYYLQGINEDWLWKYTPSAVGINFGMYGEADFIGGVQSSGNIAVMYNWRSDDIGLFASGSGDGRVGTLNCLEGGIFAGPAVVYGASSNDVLEGTYGEVGASVQLDAFAKAGLNYNHTWAFDPQGQVAYDPVSGHAIRSDSLNVTAGVNAAGTVVDAQATLGVGVTDKLGTFNLLQALAWVLAPLLP